MNSKPPITTDPMTAMGMNLRGERVSSAVPAEDSNPPRAKMPNTNPEPMPLNPRGEREGPNAAGICPP